WAEGNAMAFIIHGPTDTANVTAYGNDGGTDADRWPELIVELADGSTVNSKTANPDDTAEEIRNDARGIFDPGSVYTSSDLELTYDGGNSMDQLVGLRFPGLAIPPGAAITNAYIQFTAKES